MKPWITTLALASCTAERDSCSPPPLTWEDLTSAPFCCGTSFLLQFSLRVFVHGEKFPPLSCDMHGLCFSGGVGEEVKEKWEEIKGVGGRVVASVRTVSKKVRDYTSGIPLEQIERGGGWKTERAKCYKCDKFAHLWFDNSCKACRASFIHTYSVRSPNLSHLLCASITPDPRLCVRVRRRVKFETASPTRKRVADVGVRPIHHKDISSLWGW